MGKPELTSGPHSWPGVFLTNWFQQRCYWVIEGWNGDRIPGSHEDNIWKKRQLTLTFSKEDSSCQGKEQNIHPKLSNWLHGFWRETSPSKLLLNITKLALGVNHMAPHTAWLGTLHKMLQLGRAGADSNFLKPELQPLVYTG